MVSIEDSAIVPQLCFSYWSRYVDEDFLCAFHKDLADFNSIMVKNVMKFVNS